MLPTMGKPRRAGCGSNARYASGCRCLACRVARARYEARRREIRKRGGFDAKAAAARVRLHIAELRRRSVGLRAIAAASGLDRLHLKRIADGKIKGVTKRTARLVMDVDESCLENGALVPAGPTRMLVRRLLGWHYPTKGQLARALGYTSPALHFLGRKRIRAKTALQVRRLWERCEGGR